MCAPVSVGRGELEQVGFRAKKVLLGGSALLRSALPAWSKPSMPECGGVLLDSLSPRLSLFLFFFDVRKNTNWQGSSENVLQPDVFL